MKTQLMDLVNNIKQCVHETVLGPYLSLN